MDRKAFVALLLLCCLILPAGPLPLFASNRPNPALDAAAPVPLPTFTDVAGPMNAAAPGYGTAVAWGDYDGDGDQDLYVVNLGPGGGGQSNALLRNDGITFTDVSAEAGVADSGPGVAAVWGDMDNDGDLDLFVSNRPGNNALFRNEGNGHFTNVAAQAGVTDPSGYGEGSAWADIDGDGLLDLYVANYSSAPGNQPNRLFQNQDGLHFSDVAAERGVAHMGNGEGIAWADFDNDGDMDLYIANANYGANVLFQQQADGTYLNVAAQMHVLGGPGRSFGAAWGDYDNDGWLDLYVAQEGTNKLYRNLGGTDFADVTAQAGVGGNAWSMGCAWGDFDSDGWLDLHVANATVGGYDPADVLYRNTGGTPITFANVTALCGVTNTLDARGNAWSDFDNDGDLDLYVVNQGSGLPNRLFRNNGTPNHWLQVRLIGCNNRSAIGARVTVESDRTQIREISGGSGFASQDSLPAEFGLGDWADPVTVTVRWPGGVLTSLAGILPDQIITITRPCFDLTDAAKAVSAAAAVPGTAVTYTLTLPNAGELPAPARLTDTLPVGLTWAGYVTATSGTPDWDPAGRCILWAGSIPAGAVVTVTYRATVNPGLAPGLTITNVATVDDGYHPPFDTPPVTLTTLCQELSGLGFFYSPPAPVVGSPITFTAVATGSLPILFAWAFDDGSYGSGPTVTHTYSAAGDYAVVLTASNACGLDTVVHIVRVVSSCIRPAGADFTWTPPTPLAGKVVTFTGGVVTGTPPLTYTWAFGDGGAAEGAVVSHTYGLGGDYQVILSVTNACGWETVSRTVPICGAVQGLLLNWTPPLPFVGEVVTLTASATGTLPITFTWNLGDGTGAEGPIVYHVYDVAGTYTVALTATNCRGQGLAVTHSVLEIGAVRRLIYLPLVLKGVQP